MLIAGSRYRARESLDLVVRTCEDGILIFDNVTGDTHLIDFAAWALLFTLLPSDFSSGQPGLELHQFPDVSIDSEHAASVLKSLEATGLIVRC